MKSVALTSRALVLAIAASLLPTLVVATPAPTPTPPAAERSDADLARARRELEAAKRDLERASSRLAELSAKLYRGDWEKALVRPAFERPVIGIVMSTDDGAGVTLAGVTPDSPAAKAGLRSGDRLLRINGQTLGEGEGRLDRARKAIGELEDGTSVRLSYEREGVTKDVTVKAVNLPGLVFWRGEGRTPAPVMPMMHGDVPIEWGRIAPLAGCGAEGGDCLLATTMDAYRWRGLRLAGLEAKLGRYFGSDHGVLVLTTPNDELAGLQPGDVILEIDGERVDQPQQAMRQMRGKEPGTQIQIEFLRDHKTQHAQLEAPKHAHFPLLPPPPVPPAPPAPPAAPTPHAAPAPHAVPAPPAPPAPPTPPPDDHARGIVESVLHY